MSIHNEEFTATYIPKFTAPEAFVDAKIKMLTEHFKLELDDEDYEMLQKYKTENEINAVVKWILNKYWV